jgi:hypothetical protein
MTGYCPVFCFCGALADHDLRRHEAFAALTDTRPRHPQRPSAAQACGWITAQSTPTLHKQRLVNGFVADAHAVVIRKVDA